MLSHSAWKWLLRKEWRELMTSRSWWVMLALIGPLVGVSFISAVRSYAEASGQGGTAAGLADALFPLDGVVAPTFSAYEIAASFLLPFVAIRAIAGDRTSGALKLELQQGMTPLSMMSAKVLVLAAGWLLAAIPILLAGILWVSYGGSLYAPEIGSLALGHLLNAGLVIALAAAAASLSEHPSTAAILVLAFTVGTWVLGFVAAFQGGIWEQIASYTPSEMLQSLPARARASRPDPGRSGADRRGACSCLDLDAFGRSGATPRDGIGRCYMHGGRADLWSIVRQTELGCFGKRAQLLCRSLRRRS